MYKFGAIVEQACIVQDNGSLGKLGVQEFGPSLMG